MSTRALVGILLPNGNVKSIYVHNDGYPESPGVGSKLLEHWTDRKKVERLLKLGDLSVLGIDIGRKHDFDKPIRGMTTAYGRDRGEPDTAAGVCADPACFTKSIDGMIEHGYLLAPGPNARASDPWVWYHLASGSKAKWKVLRPKRTRR